MKQLTAVFTITALTAFAPAMAEMNNVSISAPVVAEVNTSISTPTDSELAFAIGDNQNLQAVVMTDEQMQETEGARIPKFIKNIRIDGPDKGFKEHYNGKIVQIRYGSTVKTRTPIFRIDYHNNPSPTKLHFHIAPDINVHRPWNAPWNKY